MGVSVGISTKIGRLLGSGGDNHTAARFATHGLLLALVLMVTASGIGLLTLEPLFSLIGASPELLPIIKQYMSVWYLAIPLLVIPMAGNSAIRATGDAKTPAKIMMLAGGINGVLDPLLIFGYGPFPELGVKGAAIASGISWAFALIYSLYILIRREKLLAMPQLRLFSRDCHQIMQVGTPAAPVECIKPPLVWCHTDVAARFSGNGISGGLWCCYAYRISAGDCNDVPGIGTDAVHGPEFRCQQAPTRIQGDVYCNALRHAVPAVDLYDDDTAQLAPIFTI